MMIEILTAIFVVLYLSFSAGATVGIYNTMFSDYGRISRIVRSVLFFLLWPILVAYAHGIDKVKEENDY